MVLFSDLSNKEKVAFLIDVLDCYLRKCSELDFDGLCSAVVEVYHNRYIDLEISAAEFMGYGIWNYDFACGVWDGYYTGCYWWPVNETFPRVQFLLRLIRMYNV